MIKLGYGDRRIKEFYIRGEWNGICGGRGILIKKGDLGVFKPIILIFVDIFDIMVV